jgi:hypothetical protein
VIDNLAHAFARSQLALPFGTAVVCVALALADFNKHPSSLQLLFQSFGYLAFGLLLYFILEDTVGMPRSKALKDDPGLRCRVFGFLLVFFGTLMQVASAIADFVKNPT